jgi:hypothetical protein
MALGA